MFCGLDHGLPVGHEPIGHDRQRDYRWQCLALYCEIDVCNLMGQPVSDIALSHRFSPPLLAALVASAPVQAQIVTNGPIGSKVSLHGGQIGIGADLGTRRGDNLFHSFEKFGIEFAIRRVSLKEGITFWIESSSPLTQVAWCRLSCLR